MAFAFPRLPSLALIMLLAAMPMTAAVAAPPAMSAQVGVLPPAPGAHPDLEALLHEFWRDYFEVGGPLGFTLDNIRVGRIDLNDDDIDELILMIDLPGWRVDAGKPFVVATWRNKAWAAVGWGWGDEDQIFRLTETIQGWHSLDTGSQILHWNGREYERESKTITPLTSQPGN